MTALDYYTIAPQTPLYTGMKLLMDIRRAFKFWRAVQRDVKHIKKENFGATVDFETSCGNLYRPFRLSPVDENTAFDPSVNLTQGTSFSAQTLPVTASKSRIANGSTLTVRTVGEYTGRSLTDDSSNSIERQFKIFLHKRHLILILLADEIERLIAWLYPRVDNQGEYEAECDEYLKKVHILSIHQFDQQKLDQQEKNLKETTKFAWEISPDIAVHLNSRFRKYAAIKRTLQELIRANPEPVSHMTEASLSRRRRGKNEL